MESRTTSAPPTTPVNQAAVASNQVTMDDARAPQAQPALHKFDPATKDGGSAISDHKARQSRRCSDSSDTEQKVDDDHCNFNTKDEERAHSPRQTRQLTRALRPNDGQRVRRHRSQDRTYQGASTDNTTRSRSQGPTRSSLVAQLDQPASEEAITLPKSTQGKNDTLPAVSEGARQDIQQSFRELKELVDAQDDANTHKGLPLDRMSSTVGQATPDQRLAEHAAGNEVHVTIGRALNNARRRLRYVAEDRVACADDSDSSASSTSSSSSADVENVGLDQHEVDAAYGSLISEIITERPTMPVSELAWVVKPLSTALQNLLLHTLPSSSQTPAANETNLNAAEVTSMHARALAPTLRKVLFAMTRLATKQQCGEKTTLAFISIVANVVSGAPLASALASAILETNDLGEVVFMAPELGKWTTCGGLGVMVDELTVGLAALGVKVTVISPFYDRNKKGKTDYLRADGVHWEQNIRTVVGNDVVEVGLHEGYVNGVRLIFLHNPMYLPSPYPDNTSRERLRAMILMAKGSLEALCQLRLIPNMIVTNDWFTGLVPAFAKSGAFGQPSVFADTFFFHLVHNLDVDYEGRLYFDPCEQGSIDHMVQLSPDLFKDPFWHPANNQIIYNPSRAALLSSDSWGTVSPSYRDELLQSSPLAPLMGKSAHPFAYVNGIPTAARTQRLDALSLPDSADAPLTRKQRAKSVLQHKYFGWVDPSIPLFAYVGRITEQKGVHHILSVAEQKIKELDGNIMFLVGGPGNPGEQYSVECMHKMDVLRHRYPSSFWADPKLFFTDGPLVNLGADAGLMPSKFEPSGIVQQEFFVAGTPVVAFKTGGLKDTVFDFSHETGLGNGFTFEAHTHDDFYSALNRAVDTFKVPAHAAQLCKNARDSVLDLATVSFSWYKEFMRCRKCLVDVAPLLVRFPAPVVEGAAAMPNVVKVRGDFTNGREVELVLDSGSGEMTHRFKLADATYMYEFVVDGQTALAPGVPTLTMKDGSKSHVAVIKQLGGV